MDEDGNIQVPSTTFTWTIEEIDPVTAIGDLIAEIGDVDDMSNGVKQSLISQLRVALRFVSGDNTANDFISCKELDTFAALVKNFEDKGRLPTDEADDLIQQAQMIKDAIGYFTSSAMQANEVAAEDAAIYDAIPNANGNTHLRER